jgi:coenzyme F420-dependent glucose-6-phosphate dehydrogenase
MSEKNGKIVGAETIREAGCFSADPEEHVKHARKYIDLGFDHLIFHSAGPDQQAFIEGYGRDVLPKLRRQSKGSSKAAQRKRAAAKSKGR